MEIINDTLAFFDTLKNAINALENLGEVGYVLRKFQE
jgi:hypothetical protein